MYKDRDVGLDIGTQTIAICSNREIKIFELADSEPLVYISLGSMLNNAKFFYTNCIETFKEQPYKVIISVKKKNGISGFKKLPPTLKYTLLCHN